MTTKGLMELAYSSVQRRKKDSLLVFSVLMLSFVFMVLSLSLSDSIDVTNAEYRKDTYGAWYGAVFDGLSEDEGWFREQSWLDELGTVQGYGKVYGDGVSSTPYIVASINEEFCDIGRLTLEEGEMPWGDGEIAMTRQALSACGYGDAELGDEIALSLRGIRMIPEIGVEAPPFLWRKEQRFTLCGVLDNYSIFWDTARNNWQGRTPPQIIITREMGETILADARAEVTEEDFYSPDQVQEELQYYFSVQQGTGDKALAEVTEYMEATRRDDQAKAPNFNENTFSKGQESYNRYYTVLIFTVTVFSVLCTYLLKLQEQIRSYAVFRSIGITRKQLAGLIGAETLLLALPAVLLGIALGAFLTWAVLRLLLFTGSVPVQLVVPWGRLLVAGVLWLLTVLLARLAVFVLAVQAPLTGRFTTERGKGQRLKRIRQGLVAVLTILLVVASIFTAMFSFSPLHKRDYALKTPFYTLEGLSAKNSLALNDFFALIDQETVDELADLPGVATAHGANSFSRRRKKTVTISFAGLEERPTSLIAIDEEHWDDIFRFGWGGIDREAFHNGEVILLTMMVDPLMEGQTEEYTDSFGTDELYYAAEGDMDVLPLDGKITLCFGASKPFTVETVAGDVQILPYGTNTWANASAFWSNPYTVVCSHAFLKNVLDGMGEGNRLTESGLTYVSGQEYGYEYVYLEPDRGSEAAFSTKALDQYIREHRKAGRGSLMVMENNINNYIQDSTQELVMLWGSGGCVVLVLLFILISTLSLEAEGERKKYSTLRIIGMSKKQVGRETFRRSLKRCLGAVAVGWLVYLGYALAVGILPGAEDLSHALWVWKINMGYVGVRWYWVALLTAVCILLPLLVMTRINTQLTREKDFHDSFIGD